MTNESIMTLPPERRLEEAHRTRSVRVHVGAVRLATVAAAAGLAALLPAARAGAQAAGGGGGVRSPIRVLTTQDTVLRTTTETERRLVQARTERHAQLIRLVDSLHRALRQEEVTTDRRKRIAEEIANAMSALTAASAQLRAPTRAPARAPVVHSFVEVAPMERARQELVASGFHRAWAPKGWIGLNVSGSQTMRIDGGETFVRFERHPAVVSIDQGSPAEQVGIRRGDTLVAFNGRDVRGELSMNQLLRPGMPLDVRVRREGATREFTMKVAEIPEVVLARESMVSYPRAPIGSVGGTGSTVITSPRVRTTIALPGARGGTSYVISGAAPTFVINGNAAVAGALLEPIDEVLGEALGVKQGVLVLQALKGTPADLASLSRGDVIVRAAGRTVTDVVTLRNAIAAEYGDVELEVLRKGQVRKVTLKKSER